MNDTQTIRSDKENLRILETLRPRYESLREQKIRAESEVERLRKELAAARQEAEQQFGTSDVDGLRGIARDAYAANTAAVDEFAAVIAEIEAQVNQLVADGEVDSGPSALP